MTFVYKFSDHFDSEEAKVIRLVRQVKAAQAALIRAEDALAAAMLAMAKADCKGAPGPENRMRAARRAHDAAVQHLNKLKAELQSVYDLRSNGAEDKSNQQICLLSYYKSKLPK